MHSQIINFDYSKKKHFGILLASDLHIGSKAHDRKLMKYEFDEAARLGYRILINGDWGEFIISGDRKRYSPSGDKFNSDNPVNRTIDEAYEFLKEYAELIDFIGCGNHETSMSKFHGIDVTQSLIALLNHSKKTSIRHGQYSGFARFKFHHGKNANIKSRDLFYNHGQGGTAEISKGMIDINRHMTANYSDFIWLSHKHTKFILPAESMCYMNNTGDIISMERKGIMTGAYVKTHGVYDALETGYKSNYGEERMRTRQSTGGFFLTMDICGNEIKSRIIEP